MTSWYLESGPESDVVISTRIRLARNLKDVLFPVRITKGDEVKLLKKVEDALPGRSRLKNETGNLKFIRMEDLDNMTKMSMVERHLISPEFAMKNGAAGLVLSDDENISIMVNEEDHLRIQTLYPGMQLEKAWEACGRVDDMMEGRLEYAFDERFGYLTCCPTNVGTGIRASVMAHLPALVMTGHIRSVLDVVNKVGMAIRGLYGEGTEALGNMFQISNQVSLGQAEEEIISNLSAVSRRIVEQERVARQHLMKDRAKLEDKLCRSFGILANSRIISSDEAIRLLSDVKLGIHLGIIDEVTPETINHLMIVIQPATLQKSLGKSVEAQERDMERAEIIRTSLRGK